MTKKLWTELICDHCGCAEHHPGSIINEYVGEYGWSRLNSNKYFCSKECLEEYKANNHIKRIN